MGEGFQEGLLPSMPRETGAIFSAIYLAFSREIKKAGIPQTLKRLGELMPVLIALNEIADLGVSARLRRQSGCSQTQFYPLLALENKLREILEERIREFLAKPGCGKRERQIIDVLVNDFLLLSEQRNRFPPSEWPSFLEIDSGIFETACVALVLPVEIKKANIDFPGTPCSTIENLLKKYNHYLIHGNNRSLPENKAALGILALHAAEMVLKISDDQRGRNLDPLLGLPNFYQYGEVTGRIQEKAPEEILGEIKRQYLRLAWQGGISPFLIKASRVLASGTSVLKARRAITRAPVIEDPWSLGRILDGRYTTTLRHLLTPVLNELFR